MTWRQFKTISSITTGRSYEPAWQLYSSVELTGAEVKLLLITTASEVRHVWSASLNLQVLLMRYTPIKYSVYVPILIWMCIKIWMHWGVLPCQCRVCDNTYVAGKGWRKTTMSCTTASFCRRITERCSLNLRTQAVLTACETPVMLKQEPNLTSRGV